MGIVSTKQSYYPHFSFFLYIDQVYLNQEIRSRRMDIYKLNYAYLLLFIAITAVKKYLEFIKVEPYCPIIQYHLSSVYLLNSEHRGKTFNTI